MGEKKYAHRKIIFLLFLASTLSLNIFLFWEYFPFSENKGLLEEMRKISENFGSDDLVLIDRSASGDGWAMISGPMSFIYGKNAVYFFNSEDLKKIDRTKFSRIYLVSSNQNAKMYELAIGKEKLSLVKEYSFETDRIFGLGGGKDLLLFTQKGKIGSQGKIFEIR
jgi:hypothetical protein